MRTWIQAIALLGIPVLLAGTAPAPPPPLDEAANLSGYLSHGRYRTHSITLRADVEYTFTGACDRDCTDLDLRLYDENWNLVDRDVLPDDFPVVSVVPSWTGRFHLRVSMANCSISPCAYVVGVS